MTKEHKKELIAAIQEYAKKFEFCFDENWHYDLEFDGKKYHGMYYSVTIFPKKYEDFSFSLYFKDKPSKNYLGYANNTFPPFSHVEKQSMYFFDINLKFKNWLKTDLTQYILEQESPDPFQEYSSQIESKRIKDSFDVNYDENDILNDDEIKLLASKFNELEESITKEFDLTEDEQKELKSINLETIDYAKKGVKKSDLGYTWLKKIYNFGLNYSLSKGVDALPYFYHLAVSIFLNQDKLLPIIENIPEINIT